MYTDDKPKTKYKVFFSSNPTIVPASSKIVEQAQPNTTDNKEIFMYKMHKLE